MLLKPAGSLLLYFSVSQFIVATHGQGCVEQTWCASVSLLCNANVLVERNCPVTCNKCGSTQPPTASWENWLAWTSCSLLCGGGQRIRLRQCSVPGQCIGENNQAEACNQQPCSPVESCKDLHEGCRNVDAATCNEDTVRSFCPKLCNVCSTGPRWSDWSNWSDCTEECGGGEQSRSRTCSEEGKCDGAASETRKCNEQECVTPVWSSWSEWGTCSLECGGGSRSRSRTCSVEGKCPGLPNDSQACNEQPCPIKEYTDWSDYGTCSLSCGGGVQSRTRVCTSGLCDKHTQEIQNCNMQKCLNSNCQKLDHIACSTISATRCSESLVLFHCPHYCKTCEEWSAYGPCSPPCGVGMKTRTRGDESQSITCLNEKCGEVVEWGDWSAFSECSEACGEGTKQRTRLCPRTGSCVGLGTEQVTCQVKACQGTWDEWSLWSQCKVKCGGGEVERTRVCNGPGDCIGDAKETRECNTEACKEYSSWTEYGRCSSSCGGGVQSRSRTCNRQSCGGHLAETRNCNTQLCSSNGSCKDLHGGCARITASRCDLPNVRKFCPKLCKLCPSGGGPEWSEYGPCSVRCGVGMKTRTKGTTSQSITCIITGCDPNAASWGDWSAYGDCSVACGTGTRSRSRTCSKENACDGLSEETISCTESPCKGTWENWSIWSACTAACGSGETERTRTCRGPGECTGAASEKRQCNTQPCRGTWENWSIWSTCTASCGSGETERTRTCTGPGTCTGATSEKLKCNTLPCRGTWEGWSTWSKCTALCGTGQTERTRTCKGPGTCTGAASEKRQCNTQPCEGTWENWSTWSACTAACGTGQTERTRSCKGPGTCTGAASEKVQCNTQPCRGKWENWSNWSTCTASCGTAGETERTRTCTGPGTCIGDRSQKRPCNTTPCQGSWENWSNWSKCTASCGTGGESERTRLCTGPGQCIGDKSEKRACNTQPCEGNWENWSNWSKCTVSCGTGGETERTRLCTGPGECIGKKSEKRACNTQPCRGEWLSWGGWGSCNANCGGGSRTRTRSCQGPGQCVGVAQQSSICNSQECQDGWHPWEKWGGCDKACGPGNRKRIRVCIEANKCKGAKEETKPCNLRTCTQDAQFSSCSRPCGLGIKTKLLSTGIYAVESCNDKDCPVASCGSGEYHKYKDPSGCCTKVPSTSPVCHQEAGQRTLKTIRRIIGGQTAQKGDWPWMVFIHNTQWGTACGGAIISDKYILTAAHCLRTDSGFLYPTTYFKLMLGLVDIGNFDRSKSPVLKRTLVYPDYSFPNHDIGLIELTDAIQKFDQYIRPICLPHGEEIPNDATCVAMGWGVSNNSFPQVTTKLQYVDLKVYDSDVCVHGYTINSGLTGYVPFLKRKRGYICSGHITENKDSCSGDSGSPLVCQRCDTCGWFVAGVVSFGPTPCALAGAPGIYTKVADYEQWIYHVTGITKEELTCSNKS